MVLVAKRVQIFQNLRRGTGVGGRVRGRCATREDTGLDAVLQSRVLKGHGDQAGAATVARERIMACYPYSLCSMAVVVLT